MGSPFGENQLALMRVALSLPTRYPHNMDYRAKLRGFYSHWSLKSRSGHLCYLIPSPGGGPRLDVSSTCFAGLPLLGHAPAPAPLRAAGGRQPCWLCPIAFCTWTMHFSALTSAARDAVLEAPSPFHSIRFPGHSENLFISSLSSLYISSFLPHPPLTAVQISMTDTNTQICTLIFLFPLLFLFRLAFLSVSFFSQWCPF